MGKAALFVLDPLSAISPRTDSSYVMVLEAARRGHEPWFVELEGLAVVEGRAMAHARTISIPTRGGPVVAADHVEWRPLDSFDVVLMRKDPPVDAGFVAATWILDRAGTLVVNRPAALRDHNEKLSILRFPTLIPATKVLRRIADLRAALDEFGGRMIVKPLFGYGGREVLLARAGDPNLGTIFELATADGTRWTIAQAFVPEAAQGDKRILLVDGQPIGAVLRVPQEGELRDNFHAGGRPALTELSERDLQICAEVGPFLRQEGIFFSGIDVIGGYLTEINVTSPTGMQEIDRLNGLEGDETMPARFWAGLERHMSRD